LSYRDALDCTVCQVDLEALGRIAEGAASLGCGIEVIEVIEEIEQPAVVRRAAA
jgi:hypothetical protein